LARPRILPQSPEQAERQARFEDVLRWADLSWDEFCVRHGFHSVSLWRWIRNGDPRRPPYNGRATSSKEFGKALDVDADYFRPGGPRIETVRPLPYRP
jgi:hypothetical protein